MRKLFISLFTILSVVVLSLGLTSCNMGNVPETTPTPTVNPTGGNTNPTGGQTDNEKNPTGEASNPTGGNTDPTGGNTDPTGTPACAHTGETGLQCSQCEEWLVDEEFATTFVSSAADAEAYVVSLAEDMMLVDEEYESGSNKVYLGSVKFVAFYDQVDFYISITQQVSYLENDGAETVNTTNRTKAYIYGNIKMTEEGNFQVVAKLELTETDTVGDNTPTTETSEYVLTAAPTFDNLYDALGFASQYAESYVQVEYPEVYYALQVASRLLNAYGEEIYDMIFGNGSEEIEPDEEEELEEGFEITLENLVTLFNFEKTKEGYTVTFNTEVVATIINEIAALPELNTRIERMLPEGFYETLDGLVDQGALALDTKVSDVYALVKNALVGDTTTDEGQEALKAFNAKVDEIIQVAMDDETMTFAKLMTMIMGPECKFTSLFETVEALLAVYLPENTTFMDLINMFVLQGPAEDPELMDAEEETTEATALTTAQLKAYYEMAKGYAQQLDDLTVAQFVYFWFMSTQTESFEACLVAAKLFSLDSVTATAIAYLQLATENIFEIKTNADGEILSISYPVFTDLSLEAANTLVITVGVDEEYQTPWVEGKLYTDNRALVGAALIADFKDQTDAEEATIVDGELSTTTGYVWYVSNEDGSYTYYYNETTYSFTVVGYVTEQAAEKNMIYALLNGYSVTLTYELTVTADQHTKIQEDTTVLTQEYFEDNALVSDYSTEYLAYVVVFNVVPATKDAAAVVTVAMSFIVYPEFESAEME